MTILAEQLRVAFGLGIAVLLARFFLEGLGRFSVDTTHIPLENGMMQD